MAKGTDKTSTPYILYKHRTTLLSWMAWPRRSFGCTCINASPDSKVHGANMGPFRPRWAPYWPHEPCYQGVTCYLLPHWCWFMNYLDVTWAPRGLNIASTPLFVRQLVQTNNKNLSNVPYISKDQLSIDCLKSNCNTLAKLLIINKTCIW